MKNAQITTGQNKVLSLVNIAVTVLMSGFFTWYLFRTIQIIILNY
jgi:hypothetical protein